MLPGLLSGEKDTENLYKYSSHFISHVVINSLKSFHESLICITETYRRGLPVADLALFNP